MAAVGAAAVPAKVSRASRTMLTSGTTASGPLRLRPGNSTIIPGAKHRSISGTMYACASLKLRAKLVNASSNAEKKAANSTSRPST